jgi:hypothetical protein
MKKFNVRFSINLDHSGLTAINWTPFWAGLIMGFVMAALSYFVPINKMINPFPWKNNALEEIKPRLEEKINDFRLAKPIEVVSIARAASIDDKSSAYAVIDYDNGEVISDKNLSQIRHLEDLLTKMIKCDYG